MKICPECKAENKFDGAQFCKSCGAPLGDTAQAAGAAKPDLEDDLEFEVTETAGAHSPQLFGTDSPKPNPSDKEDLLEIKDNANLLDDEANGISKEENLSAHKPDPFDFGLNNNIEPSKPVEKPVQAESEEKPAKAEEFKVDWSTPADKKKEPETATPNTDIKPAIIPTADDFSKSRSEIKDNEPKPFPNPEKKKINPALIKEEAAKIDEATVKKSSRVTGNAFFYRNIIQLAGSPFLHENDEIIYNSKPYRLKPYRPSKRTKQIAMAVAAVLVVILLGAQFIGPTLPGEGQIVGIVLDEYSQPYLGGANVVLPELGKSTTSNELGFFRFNDIPTGTYELIYRIGDNYQGTDYVTVTDGSIIMRSFGDFAALEDEAEYSQEPAVPESNSKEPEQPTKKESTKKDSNKSSTTKKSTGYGKIKLESNVEQAKFVVDGEVLGAGDNTYTKIKAGTRKVQVSKPGYTEYTEVITVTKDQTYSLRANLSRKASDKNDELTANDYFELGNDSFRKEDYQAAIKDYTKAIGLSPNNIDAYTKRAKAYSSLGQNDKATADYIRLGEIYSFRKQNDMAITQFATALKYSPNSTTALVGRGNSRMDKGEYRSALIDYMQALDIDDNFYPARFGAGVAEFKLGDTKNAEKHLIKAKKLNDTDPKLYHYIMLNYLAMDKIKNVKKTYAQYKEVADPQELAEFKASGQFAPVLRLIDPEDQ